MIMRHGWKAIPAMRTCDKVNDHDQKGPQPSLMDSYINGGTWTMACAEGDHDACGGYLLPQPGDLWHECRCRCHGRRRNRARQRKWIKEWRLDLDPVDLSAGTVDQGGYVSSRSLADGAPNTSDHND